MPAADEPLRYRRLRAPTEDQTALIEPPLAEIPRLLEKNIAILRTCGITRTGLDLAKLRLAAGQKVLGGACCYTNNYQEAYLPNHLGSGMPLILSGHQPELFHAGVWFKNFLLSEIARRVHGTAINLIVDNDTIGSAAIHVPSSLGDSFAPIPFDAPTEEIPFEERAIRDSAVFNAFAQRAGDAMGVLRSEPVQSPENLIVSRLWPLAEAAMAVRSPQIRDGMDQRFWNFASKSTFVRTSNLGRVIAQARHKYEEKLGLQTLELPLSLVSRDEPFRMFAAHLFLRSDELLPAYNSALHEYRIENKVHSTSHPVPALVNEGEWNEVPFWIWTTDQPRRRRLFVRRSKVALELSDRGNLTIRIDLPKASSLESLVAHEWNDLESAANWRIRPRALITTMYARLVLSDLFIHGIGGAKYDEVTDAIIRRFFNIEPPGYVTATATVRLPLERPPVTPEDLTALDQEYRDTIHHPEEFVEEYSGHQRAEFAALVKQKQELIAHRWQDKQKKAWHHQVSQANERMSSLLERLRDRLRNERERLISDLHRARILGSREYSFCLFPEDMLVPLLKRIAGLGDSAHSAGRNY